MKRRLVLIDGHAIVFRAYYAYPASLTTPEGEQINAVYGFASILLSVVRELAPTHIAVAFDLDKPTFRHIDYAGYKAQRPEVDVELTNQLDRVREVVEVLSMPIFQVEGFEADDVIGTLARQAADGGEVIIVTGDQDAMQLVDDSVRVWLPKRGKQEAKLYGVEEVKQKFELTPEQIVDLKALAGDASDNIPGVRGIGPKGASTLIQEFGSLENLYQHLDSKKIKPRIQELLKTYKDDAFMSKKLATIVTNLPIKFDLEKAPIGHYNPEKVTDVFQKFEFRSLLKSLPASMHSVRAVPTKKTEHIYDVVETEDGMKKLAEKLAEQKQIGFDTETEGLDPLCDKMLGASFAWSDGGAAFVHARTDSQRATFVKNFRIWCSAICASKCKP